MRNLSYATAEFFKTNLQNADLSGADLSSTYVETVNLSDANLEGAILKRAYLVKVDLSGANLAVSTLSGAQFVETDLSGADLSLVDLSEVDFQNTDLSGADLQDAKNLFQFLLDNACGDNKTLLPQGLTVKACPTTSELIK